MYFTFASEQKNDKKKIIKKCVLKTNKILNTLIDEIKKNLNNKDFDFLEYAVKKVIKDKNKI